MTAAAVTVYTTGPQCQKCNLTKRFLNKRGIPFKEVRLDNDPDTLDQLKANGFGIAPVVEARIPDGSVDRWCDFRLDRLEALAKAMAA
ncbi:NrdH-like glutaredoxin [Mycobacterium phage Patt]|uniref:NrdH-like glutaredoxin n=6 Tax=Fionnbharthvirus TaxID=2948708 RepID=A0A1J0MDS4_9CAUD|nr:NrdH-like glutaredoxin [Mycobacterium phage Fionnbharth]YP_009215668.1 nrdh-like glutaredoxin [Mycobacterium phage Cheetobro]YP_009950505.1 NrdH-like glutaredoxin [Mycobacterium phage Taquito]YP_009950597.1 NrdH-like glutaredoxin [Mycobacterium phage Patt]ALA46341.1 hypothetical protein PBI_SLARP_70 [Mycobacterium phage Slarp]APD19197.1 NrdH-like glutaredoxin [Mycobacterium phage Mitti]ASR87777.1 NrdH-like glutaredoxin [Mycobacterium phage Wintermute]ASW31710.1 NrdH-like glutaredoxin [Myc